MSLARSDLRPLREVRDRELAPARRDAPTIGAALERTYSAGQRLARDHLALLLLEVREKATAFGLPIALLAAAGVLALLGWIGLAAALVLWDWGLPLEARVAIVAGAHLIVAAILAAWARVRLGAAAHDVPGGDALEDAQ